MNNQMIDVHSHVLYGIDDGSKTKEESIEILKKLRTLGFTSVVATPHYIEGSAYQANHETKKNIMDDLFQEIKLREDLPNLYLGNEIYIFHEIEEAIKNNKIETMNHSRYLLIEFSFTTQPLNLEEFIFDLRKKGFVPIIAHPERYQYVQKNPEIVRNWVKTGALLQGNYGSMSGRYGSAAKDIFQYLIYNGYYQFLGTDMHRSESSFYDKFHEIKEKIIKLIGNQEFQKISFDNPKKMLTNEEIEVTIPIHPTKLKKEKTFFSILKVKSR